jgi:membrane associated rhomboid family serine protease
MARSSQAGTCSGSRSRAPGAGGDGSGMIPLRDILPTRRYPIVTVVLIAINVAVYAYQVMLGKSAGAFVASYAMTPFEITHGTDVVGAVGGSPIRHAAGPPIIYLTLITSMFMHGGLLHLGGNMLYLWIFGNNVEDYLGRAKFIAFYFLCGLGAHAAQIAVSRDSTIPTLGASGAIAGVLAAYLVLYPKARVLSLIFLGIFIRVIEIPAFILILFWILLQSLQGFVSLGAGQIAQGGVAWFEHIGGFASGLVLLIILSGGLRGRPRQRVIRL